MNEMPYYAALIFYFGNCKKLPTITTFSQCKTMKRSLAFVGGRSKVTDYFKSTFVYLTHVQFNNKYTHHNIIMNHKSFWEAQPYKITYLTITYKIKFINTPSN